MKIVQGIEKFKSDVYPKMEGQFAELKKGQAPETLFITCSDSRIDPHLLMQATPGELFIIRNAGNIVPLPGAGELSVEATIQYAVDVLKVSQIVVCGHSHCGAVTGLLNLDSLESLPVIRDWVKRSEKVLERITDSDIPTAINENVKLQLENLREHECVAKAIADNRLTLHGWVYHFENGTVDFLTDEAV
ncbi:MAG: carbonic anhydrase [Mariniblastus sp.]